MTVTLNLKPEVEAAARASAAARHIALEEYLNDFLAENLPAPPQYAVRQRNIERNAAAIALLDKFVNTDEYGTAEEQRETLEYLKRAIDEDRPGQRSVFGEGSNP